MQFDERRLSVPLARRGAAARRGGAETAPRAERIGPGTLVRAPAEGAPPHTPAAAADPGGGAGGTPDFIQNGVVRIHSYGKEYSFLHPRQQSAPQRSIGSGVAISVSAGRERADPVVVAVLTCEHVVRGSTEVKVVLPMRSKNEIPARTISLCEDLDLALVVFELAPKYRSYVHPLELGDSDRLRQGQRLRAYGFPLGQKSLKVTDGVYSGYEQRLLMHSSPISPGNSGGALLDESHRVVGINSAVDGRSRANSVGYAVPISHLAILMDGAPARLGAPLSEQRRVPAVVQRHTLGVLLQPTTAALAEVTGCRAGCSRVGGVMVRFLFDRSPLRDVGVEAGDIVVEIDGAAVDKKGEMPVPWDNQKASVHEYLERKKNSDRVTLQIWRTRTQECLRVRCPLVDIHTHCLRTIYPPHEPVDSVCCAGVTVMPLCYNHSGYELFQPLFLKLSRAELQSPLLVITSVMQGTRAAQSEALRGAEILSHVNGKKVTTMDEYRRALLLPLFQGQALYLDMQTGGEDRRRLAMRLEAAVAEERKAAEHDLWAVDPGRLRRWEKYLRLLPRSPAGRTHDDEEDD